MASRQMPCSYMDIPRASMDITRFESGVQVNPRNTRYEAVCWTGITLSRQLHESSRMISRRSVESRKR